MAGQVFIGTNAADTLSDVGDPLAGDDVFFGLEANDLLVSSDGQDTIDGGTGTLDTADFSARTGSVFVDLSAGFEVNSGSALIAIEAVVGTVNGDVILGDAGANLLDGGGGSDAINAGAGDDTLVGGGGDDFLDGDAGFDQVSYAGAAGPVNVDLLTGIATGDGTDTLNSIEWVIGTAGNDTLIAGNGFFLLDGGSGGADSLVGGAGLTIATFASRTGSVFVDLAAGVEVNSGSTLTGIEAVTGTDQGDVILGDAAANLLNGGGGSDVIEGADGNDTLIGGGGDDDLNGGDGFDQVSYAGAAGPVDVNLATGIATGDGTDTLTSIESVVGTAGNDTLTAGAVSAQLDGGTDGADSFVGGIGFDTASFAGRSGSVFVDLDAGVEVNSGSTLTGIEAVTGTDQGDVILGDAAANLLNGGGGSDVIEGADGNDTLIGGGGDDDLNGGDGFDQVSYAGAVGPVDVNLATGIATGDGTDTLTSIESVVGTAGNDTLTAGAVSAQLDGGTDGADSFVGGIGFDTASFAGRSGSVFVDLDAGVEVNSGSTLTGIEAVTGTDQGDVILGDAQANWLNGGGGSDVIEGSDGNDTLIGGGGDDDLNGGSGTDQVFYGDATGPVNVNLATGIATGDGTDTLTSIEVVVGTDANDTLTAGGTGAWLDGGAGGADSFVGGLGFDTASFSTRTGSVFVDLDAGIEVNSGSTLTGIEAVFGSGFGDVILGDGSANWLNGAAGSDVIEGGAGDDTLIGGGGDDDLDGGTGIDFAIFAGAPGPVNVNLATGVATGDGTDILTSIEAVIGTSGDDTMTAAGSGSWLDGGSGGADSFIGGAGFDTVSFINRAGSVFVDLDAGIEVNSGSTLSGIEGALGTNQGDVLLGNGQANYLNGGGGGDVIDGGDGNDVLVGGGGDDDLDGGLGIDLVDYSGASGPVNVNLATGIATGDGIDTLTSIEGVIGTAGNDTLTAGAVSAWLDGGRSGADQFVGGVGFDTVSFAGRSGSVFVDLASGVEVNSGSTLSGIEGVLGTNDGDVLIGGAVSSWLNGGGGADVISGGAANDTLVGGLGDDDLDGAGGFDLAAYSDALNGVVVNLAIGLATGWGTDTLTNIEGVIGSAFDDTITGTSVLNSIIAGAGNDLVDGGAGNDTVYGEDGNDTLIGGFGLDSLVGGAGADSLGGDNGNDTLIGGEGNDTALGGIGNDLLDGGLGDDSLDGGVGFDTASFASAAGPVVVNLSTQSATGQGTDILLSIEAVIGTAASDTIIGDAADNTLDGGSGGADSLDGGLGFDTVSFASRGGSIFLELATGLEVNSGTQFTGFEAVIGSRFGDVIIGDSTANGISGGDGADVIDGGDGNDTLTGGAGDDDLDGGSGFDFASYTDATAGVNANLATGIATGFGTDTLTNIQGLFGSALNDTLVGNAEDNTLDGGGGVDILTGGAGADSFNFTAGLANGDTVTDFTSSQGDRLILTGYGVGATFTSLGGTAWQVANAGSTIVDVIQIVGTVSAGDWTFV